MLDRIAADIRPHSLIKRAYLFSGLLVLMGLMYMMAIPWWLVISVGIIYMVIWLISEPLANQPVHLHAPDNNNASTLWQLRYDIKGRKELWEAKLHTCQCVGQCVQLGFHIMHPVAQQKTVVIWKDQVNNETWRQLMVLARWQ